MKTHQEPKKSFPVVRDKKPNIRSRKRTLNASQLPTWWWTAHPFDGSITNELRAYRNVYAEKNCFAGVNPRFSDIRQERTVFSEISKRVYPRLTSDNAFRIDHVEDKNG